MNDQFAIFLLVATLLLLFTGANALKALLISRGATKGDGHIAKVNRIAAGAFLVYLAASAGYLIYHFGWDGAWQSIAAIAVIFTIGGIMAKFAGRGDVLQQERYQRITGTLSMVSFSIILAAVLLGGISHYVSSI